PVAQRQARRPSARSSPAFFDRRLVRASVLRSSDSLLGPMIVVMESDAPESAIEAVIAYLVQNNFDVHRSSGQTRTILGVVGDVTESDVAVVREIEAVAEVVRVSEPYRLSSRRFRQRQTVVDGDFGSIG